MLMLEGIKAAAGYDNVTYGSEVETIDELDQAIEEALKGEGASGHRFSENRLTVEEEQTEWGEGRLTRDHHKSEPLFQDLTAQSFKHPHTTQNLQDVQLQELQHHLPCIQKNIDYLSRAESYTSTSPPQTYKKKENNTVKREPEIDEWVFATSEDLQIYIMRVHVIGFVLWGSVMALDFTHPSLLIFFTAGFFAGAIFCQSRTQAQNGRLNFCLFLVYVVCVTILLVISFVNLDLYEYSVPTYVLYAMMTATGLTWGVQHPNHRIVATTHNAFITTGLMSLPMLFLLGSVQDVNVVVNQSAIGTLYLLVLEPLIKFMNVYVLILSVRSDSTIEITVILASVLCIQIVFQHYYDFNIIDEPTAVTAVITVSILIIVHTCHLHTKSRIKRDH